MRDRKNDNHRKLTEQELGRKLGTNEVVDHINTDKTDNSRGNRRVMSRSDHTRRHNKPAARRLAKLQRALTMHKRGEKLY